VSPKQPPSDELKPKLVKVNNISTWRLISRPQKAQKQNQNNNGKEKRKQNLNEA